MTVIVDDMQMAPPSSPCTMLADTDAEVHAMADAIGVGRRWFRGGTYTITAQQRAAALSRGAVAVTWRQAGLMIVFRRHAGRLPALDDVKTVQPAKGRRPDAVERLITRLTPRRTRRDAQIWLLSPCPELHGDTPASWVRDGRAAQVERLIGNLEAEAA